MVKQPSQQIIKFRFQLAIFTPSFFRYPFYTLSCKSLVICFICKIHYKTRYFLVKITTSLHYFHKNQLPYMELVNYSLPVLNVHYNIAHKTQPPACPIIAYSYPSFFILCKQRYNNCFPTPFTRFFRCAHCTKQSLLSSHYIITSETYYHFFLFCYINR